MTGDQFDAQGEAHEALSTAVTSYGARVLGDPRILGNLVTDLLPDAPRERSLLVTAAEAGVAAELSRHVESEHLTVDTAIAMVARGLTESRSIDLAASTWVATEYAQALGYQARPASARSAPRRAAAAAAPAAVSAAGPQGPFVRPRQRLSVEAERRTAMAQPGGAPPQATAGPEGDRSIRLTPDRLAELSGPGTMHPGTTPADPYGPSPQYSPGGVGGGAAGLGGPPTMIPGSSSQGTSGWGSHPGTPSTQHPDTRQATPYPETQHPGIRRSDSSRYLRGQCPGSVRAGVPFSVLASVVRDARGTARLKSFPVGFRGQDIRLVLHAPGVEVLGEQRMTVHVPYEGDSEPVMFELRADSPGRCQVDITAWLGGTYLGQLSMEIIASRYSLRSRRHRDYAVGFDAASAEGAVSLVVRYDPAQNVYRFEFRDEDNPDEVPSHLSYQPGPRVEQLVAELDRLAKGRAGYTASETRDYLREAGAGLWTELVPEELRRQFWERQERISQLTILADRDTVPWELLYPIDPGHDAGFLVEQFPVTRLVFRHRPSRALSLAPAWFVLPDGSPTQARDEVSALIRLLYGQPASGSEPVISGLTPLLELIRGGDFGLLHFACHNAFDLAAGSAISLDRRQFTPTQLNTAAIGQVLHRSKPTVFINACRSAGASCSYHQLDGWASKFIEAGAGAFIGTLWAVRDSTARAFASDLYGSLRSGMPLGTAVMQARRAAASEPGDPTWLAYAVYGDPRATLR